MLLTNNTVSYPWETTVEDPSMVAAGGGFYLAFSAGRVHQHRLLRRDHDLQRAARSVRSAEPDPHDLRFGARPGRRRAVLRRRRERGGSTTRRGRAARRGARAIQLRRGAAALRRADLAAQRQRRGALQRAGLARTGTTWWPPTAGVFNFGNLPFCGSEGGRPLNKPVVGMATTQDGGGYWLVASDGGIFTYGDAGFYGSAGSLPLNKPDRRHGGHARRRGLLAGGLRRRHLQLRRRQVLRLGRRPAR